MNQNHERADLITPTHNKKHEGGLRKMKLETYLKQKRMAAWRRQIRRVVSSLHDEDHLRELAQCASKVWLEENGGELIAHDGKEAQP